MYLTNVTLQQFLAKCLFGKNWEKGLQFVVPRKGNFINPQYLTDTDTYAVYYIARKERRVLHEGGMDYSDENAIMSRYATMKATVKVQFIGKKAEDWATSLLFWDERSDVQQVFFENQAQLLLGNRTIETVPFQQEGMNGEMSYLASFDVVINTTKEEIFEYLTDLIWLKGSLKVEK